MLSIHLLPRPLASKANFSRLGYILISVITDGYIPRFISWMRLIVKLGELLQLQKMPTT
jgi:hypothetical protein